MAVDMFLKFEGPDLQGESKDEAHSDEIACRSWEWKVRQTGTTHLAQGAGGGKAEVGDIVIKKIIDKASPNLMLHCCKGTEFDKATLVMRKVGGDESLDYLTIEMESVIISGYKTNGTLENDQMEEELSLNFAQYTTTYKPQAKGGGGAGDVVGGWSVRESKAL